VGQGISAVGILVHQNNRGFQITGEEQRVLMVNMDHHRKNIFYLHIQGFRVLSTEKQAPKEFSVVPKICALLFLTKAVDDICHSNNHHRRIPRMIHPDLMMKIARLKKMMLH
jgi:hypothetical protein